MSDSFLHAASRRALDANGGRQIDRRTNLSRHEFFARYHNQRPVVLEGLARDWAAVARWSDAGYLGEQLDAEVLILRSPDNRHFLKRDCEHFDGPFARVASMLFGRRDPRVARVARGGDRFYARAPLAGGLRDDCSLDALEELVGATTISEAGTAAGNARHFKQAKCGVWLGSAGCVTPLHYDMCHGFLAGVLGTKHFTYFSADDFRSLYPRAAQPELATALRLGLEDAAHLSCRIDASQQRHGQNGCQDEEVEALAWHATVLPGDVLYTPAYWWHHVHTADEAAALSVLVPFDPTSDEPAPNSLFASEDSRAVSRS